MTLIGKAYTEKGDARNAMLFYEKAIGEHSIENQFLKDAAEVTIENNVIIHLHCIIYLFFSPENNNLLYRYIIHAH